MISFKNGTFNFPYKVPFESGFSFRKKQILLSGIDKWSCYASAVYVIIIFSIQWYMKKRPRYHLNGALTIWNTLLAIFSWLGAYRTFPEFWHSLKEEGFYHSICDLSVIADDSVTGFWVYCFAISKFIELGDTIFIVLRKQPLIFLHWYHHVTVLLYAGMSFKDFPASGRWFMVMNYSVHSIMYTYYAFRAMKYHFPVQISILITTLQIIQMVLGLVVNISNYYLIIKGDPCSNPLPVIKFGLTIYLSYFILFTRLFYKNYILKQRPTSDKQKLKMK